MVGAHHQAAILDFVIASGDTIKRSTISWKNRKCVCVSTEQVFNVI